MKKTKPLTKNDILWSPIRFMAKMQLCKDRWICDSSFIISDSKNQKCHSSKVSWGISKMPAFDAAQAISAIIIAHLRKKGLRAFLNKMG